MNNMRKLTITIIVVSFCCHIIQAQSKQTLNLDFEQIDKERPLSWDVYGNKNFKLYPDSIQTKSGKFSIVIENQQDTSDFKAVAFTLPDNYKGTSIRLRGFIKTENVTNGYAGLWMRIDPQIAFDNMSKRGITGTTDWKEYSITLGLNPKKTEKIVIGGLLVGKGKMWLDDLRVSVDGKDLDSKNLEIFEKEIVPAQLDKEFDTASKITFPYLNTEVVDNLEVLGKVWGFLKYHHPQIAKGNYNWDYELFRILPSYLAAKNNQQRDNILTTWIEKYGNIPVCKKCSPTPNNAVLKPNLFWIDDSNLSTTLKTKLKEIYNGRNQGENYYISLQKAVGNPDFTNENPYSNMPYPDEGFRLLSLYRYWNMIEYFFPNKHLTNKSWDVVLKEYIPKFLNAKDELQYELAAVQIIGEIHDSHANLWGGGNKLSELRGNNFAPYKVEFIENKFVVTDYFNPEFSDNANLKKGDVITHINGKAVESIVDSLKPFYPGSNEASVMRDISFDLLRSPQKAINLKYVSDGQTKQQEVALYERNKLNISLYKVNKDEKSYKMLDGNIGYVTLANIQAEDIPIIKESFKKTRGIIIDIRNYPSTFVPFLLGSYFLSRPTAFVKFTQGNIDNPGEFSFSKPLEIPSDKNHYRSKLVVLVNKVSQSQAEYTAMAFRAAENCTIVGSTTAGADGNVSTIFLPGGLRTMISGIGVYYPNGKETQRIGIVPDVIVKPTISGIKQGKDEVLEKAIEIIKQ
jgi:C-terminal processing protease CtpA/Prc